MNPTGKKQVAEAVLIAALSAVVGAFITWGAEEGKRIVAEKRAAKKPADPPKDAPVTP